MRILRREAQRRFGGPELRRFGHRNCGDSVDRCCGDSGTGAAAFPAPELRRFGGPELRRFGHRCCGVSVDRRERQVADRWGLRGLYVLFSSIFSYLSGLHGAYFRYGGRFPPNYLYISSTESVQLAETLILLK